MIERIAVVLFNLGGPDSLEAVRPFLYNLFSDPAILRVPKLFRTILAYWIARKRTPIAQEIYRHIGGKSPILERTLVQATALENLLGENWRVFVAMRYWHPFSDETAAKVAAWSPDRVVLLPLYPQFSTTTTASSIIAWEQAAKAARLVAPTRAVCCYPTEPGFIATQITLLQQALEKVPEPRRILFSAHGLPARIVAQGDPYPDQVMAGARAIIAGLGVDEIDWKLCYQSRVGRLAWIGPSTDEEIRRAGQDGKAVIILPIAFVSEHSETLVELDMEYAKLAREAGVREYHRVPTAGAAPEFIGALARLARLGAGTGDLALDDISPPGCGPGCPCAGKKGMGENGWIACIPG